MEKVSFCPVIKGNCRRDCAFLKDTVCGYSLPYVKTVTPSEVVAEESSAKDGVLLEMMNEDYSGCSFRDFYSEYEKRWEAKFGGDLRRAPHKNTVVRELRNFNYVVEKEYGVLRVYSSESVAQKLDGSVSGCRK